MQDQKGLRMYRNFYGFSEEPFALNPDPKFLYLGPSHAEALASMMHGIQEKKGLMVVTGEVGVGKTMLLYALLKDLSPKIKTAFLFQAPPDLETLLKEVLRELEVPWRTQEDPLPSLLGTFRGYLRERQDRDEILTVVIDEAQTLSETVLRGLLKLHDQEPTTPGLLQILLVGHPELELKWNSETLRLLKKRIGFRCRIRPLTREEGRGYIRHRLRLARCQRPDAFTSEASIRVWQFSGGVPRIMNLLCEEALRIGGKCSSPKINYNIVRESIRAVDYLRPRHTNNPPIRSQKINTRRRAIKVSFFLFALAAFLFSLGRLLSLLFRT
jgi:general secretion pathway protein A